MAKKTKKVVKTRKVSKKVVSRKPVKKAAKPPKGLSLAKPVPMRIMLKTPDAPVPVPDVKPAPPEPVQDYRSTPLTRDTILRQVHAQERNVELMKELVAAVQSLKSVVDQRFGAFNWLVNAVANAYVKLPEAASVSAQAATPAKVQTKPQTTADAAKFAGVPVPRVTVSEPARRIMFKLHN